MRWEQFARVVVFAGHASQTVNNPFDSSLDCGACAGNPGGPSARVLAPISNEKAVKPELQNRAIAIHEEILDKHEEMTGLLDNEWLSLTVVDPEQNHQAFQYTGGLDWRPVSNQIETPLAVTSPSR
jgi:uncharacterized protein YbcC (UPF0753/DUF2309 family)